MVKEGIVNVNLLIVDYMFWDVISPMAKKRISTSS